MDIQDYLIQNRMLYKELCTYITLQYNNSIRSNSLFKDEIDSEYRDKIQNVIVNDLSNKFALDTETILLDICEMDLIGYIEYDI